MYEVFGAYLDSLREQAGIPGLAAAIVDTNGIVWERAYGQQDIARSIATRTDTPFNADGLTQTITAAMVLRCDEERRLSLDDTIGSYGVDTAEPDASVRQLLTHTSGAPDNLTFLLRPERLAPLWPIVRACAVDSYRETFATLLHQSGDVRLGSRPQHSEHRSAGRGCAASHRRRALCGRAAAEGDTVSRSTATRGRYRRPIPRSASVLTPATGLVTTVRDLAKFDLALKQGILLDSATLEHAWSVPTANGVPLPHGIGWFVQNYNGEKVVWQFGMAENASSSLMITAAGARAYVDFDGEQRRAGEAVLAGERRRDAVAVCAVVLERVRPVMRAWGLAFVLCLWSPAAGRGRVADSAVHRVYVRRSDDVR